MAAFYFILCFITASSLKFILFKHGLHLLLDISFVVIFSDVSMSICEALSDVTNASGVSSFRVLAASKGVVERFVTKMEINLLFH